MRTVRLQQDDVLVHKGLVIATEVLDAVIDATGQRLLWAFVRKGDDVMAVPYNEERVIWMADSDVLQPEDVEV